MVGLVPSLQGGAMVGFVPSHSGVRWLDLFHHIRGCDGWICSVTFGSAVIGLVPSHQGGAMIGLAPSYQGLYPSRRGGAMVGLVPVH